jgi:hypothetical protein
MLKSLLAVILLAFCSLLAAQQSLNNEAIIKMVKAGLSDDLIVTAINSQSGSYDTSTNGLIFLNKSGVSDKVVQALVTKSAGNSAQSAGGDFSIFALADSSVAYKKGDQWVDFEVERVDIKAGLLGAMVPGKAANVDGRVSGKSSRLALSPGAQIRISIPAGGNIADCQLIRLHVKGNGREFHLAGGGFMKVETGSGKDSIPFDSKETAAHIFEVVLPREIEPGEYELGHRRPEQDIYVQSLSLRGGPVLQMTSEIGTSTQARIAKCGLQDAHAESPRSGSGLEYCDD